MTAGAYPDIKIGAAQIRNGVLKEETAMMALLEARDCVLNGVGTDEISSRLLRAIPVAERALALMWISDNMQFHRMYRGEKQSDYQTLESMLQHMMTCTPEIHDYRTKKSKIFSVLQELRHLVLHGKNGDDKQ